MSIHMDKTPLNKDTKGNKIKAKKYLKRKRC